MFLVTNFLSPPQFLDETLVLHIVSLPLLSNDLTLSPLFSLSFPDFVRFLVLIVCPAAHTPELGEDPRLEVVVLQHLRGWRPAGLVLVRPGDGPDGVLNVDVVAVVVVVDDVVSGVVDQAEGLSAGHLTDEVRALPVLDDGDHAGSCLRSGGSTVQRGAARHRPRLVGPSQLSRDLLPVFPSLEQKTK